MLRSDGRGYSGAAWPERVAPGFIAFGSGAKENCDVCRQSASRPSAEDHPDVLPAGVYDARDRRDSPTGREPHLADSQRSATPHTGESEVVRNPVGNRSVTS